LKSVFIIAIVAVAMVGVMFPSVFADHYSEIKIKNAKTQVIEKEGRNLIRISLTIDNDSSKQFEPYYGYLTKDFTAYYEPAYFTADSDNIGSDACPYVNVNVSPGLEEDYILCFITPTSFSSNFRLVFMDWSTEICLEKFESENPYTEQCERTSFHPSSIPNGKKMSIESFLKIMYGENTKNAESENQWSTTKPGEKPTEEKIDETLEYIKKIADEKAKKDLEDKIAKLEAKLADEQEKNADKSEQITWDGTLDSLQILEKIKNADKSEQITWDGAPNSKEIESDSIIDNDSICGEGTIMKDGKCVSIDSICGEGTIMKDGKCVSIDSSVEGGGCLIATATYGSEMSQQVQQLRELRDNQLLQTESGSAFMSTFNDVYYSFSPIIADYERENPLFKQAVKLAITPMISSLSLMENAESESEVLGFGLSVIMLNIGMYLGVPAIVIVGIKKKF